MSVRPTRRAFLATLFAAIAVLVLPPPPIAWGQGATASVGGFVIDEHKLPIAKAQVTAEGMASGASRSTQSGARGEFEFIGLKPGEYRIAAQSPGFERKEIKVRIELNQRLRLELKLPTGGAAAAVEVTDETPLLHTSDATVGAVVSEEQVQSLPLNGRQFADLATLVPGVVHSHGAQTGSTSALYWRPGQSSALSVAGGRPGANTYLLDGTVNTDPSFNTYVVGVPPDAIREFQIQTGTYSAEFGGGGSGQINVVTQSGGNQFHGTAYEYLRNSAFDSRTFVDPEKLPHFSQNQFGANFSGPLWKNHTFFFVGYEGLRSSQRQSQIMSVPRIGPREGDFSGGRTIYDPATTRPNPSFDPSRPESVSNPRQIRDPFPGNRIPADRINPVARQVLDRFVPLPNQDGATNNLLDTRAQRLRNDLFNLRLDHAFSDGTTLMGRYTLSNETGFTPENLPGFGANHDNRVQNLTLSAVRPFNSNLTGELRFGMAKMRLHRSGENANGPDLIQELGIQGVGFGGAEAHGLPRFAIQGFEPLGDALLCTPCRYDNTNLQLGTKFTWRTGNHSFRFGGGAQRFIWNMLGFFQNRGFYQFTNGFTSAAPGDNTTGDPLASFLLGLPVLAQRQAGLPSMKMRQWAFDTFVQDDWHISRNIMLNVGLRYEYRQSLQDVSKILTNLDFVDGKPVAYVAGQSGYPKGLTFSDRNNFAPRLGAAWSPGKWAVRAGAGIFYTYPDMNLWCNQVHNVPLVFPEVRQSNNFTPSIQGFDFAPAVLGQTRVAFTALDPNAKTPSVREVSASLERDLGRGWMVQVGALGAWTRNLDRAVLVNNAQPGPGPIQPRRPYQEVAFQPGTEFSPGVPVGSPTTPVGPINLLENTGSSNYGSAWVLARRSFGSGLNVLASYTYTSNRTDAPAFRSPGFEAEVPQNSFDLGSEWGPSSCAVKHRFVGSMVWQLPYRSEGRRFKGVGGFFGRLLADWKVAFLYQAQSGYPFTIGVFGDTANTGSLLNVNPIRGQRVEGEDPNLPDGERSAEEWFNTDAFRTPDAFTFGDAGRNSMTGPPLYKADLALERAFRLPGRVTLDLRAEVFNLFNTTNYGTPNRFVNTPQFGTVTTTATPGRQLQFSTRVRF